MAILSTSFSKLVLAGLFRYLSFLFQQQILFTLIKSCRTFSLNDVPNYAFLLDYGIFLPAFAPNKIFLVYLQRVYR